MASAPRRNYWQYPTFALGTVSVGAALYFVPPSSARPEGRFGRELAQLKTDLDRKSPDAERAARVASEAQDHPAQASLARYLAGSAYLQLGETKPDRAAEVAEAAELFKQVDAAQLPEPERAKLDYRQAKAEAILGTGDPASLAARLVAAPGGADDPERRRLLGDALMRLPVPDLKRARDEWAAYLSGPTKQSAETVARTKLRLAQVCAALKQPEQARTYLKEIGPDAPADIRAQAQSQLGQMALAEGHFAEAVACFERATAEVSLPPSERLLAQYSAGVAWLRSGKPSQALAYLEAAALGDGAVAAAAKVRLAEARLASSEYQGRAAAASESLKSLAAQLPASGEWANPYVSLDEVRAAFDKAVLAASGSADFAAASTLADLSEPVAVAGRAAEQKAEALSAWATKLQLDPRETETAAAKFREAAKTYGQLAADAATPAAQAEFYRKASKNFRNAGDSAEAQAMIASLTKLRGVPDELLSAAYAEQGEALSDTRNFSGAVDALKQAVAKAAPDLAAGARVKLALAHLEQAKQKARDAAGQLTEGAKAEVSGMTQLGADLLDEVSKLPADSGPVREAQQQALFELGKLHLNQRQLVLAEERFRKLLAAQSNGAYADQARLYLGSTLLQLARGDQQAERPPANADAMLQEAAKLFEALGQSTSPYLQTQADIRLANTMLLLRKYDDMPALCDRLAAKYQGTAEELIVLSMLYSSQRLADQPDAAAKTFARMDGVFTKLPSSAFTGGADEYKRAFWEDWFAQLSQPRK